MALPSSSLSRACRSVADHVQTVFANAGHPIQVRVGTPASAVPAATDTEHRLNLFFHRFEPPGFGSYDLPGDVWWLRVHCIITAFAVDEDRISAGEGDLRLLGEVLRIFHETPVLGPIDVGGEQLQAQVIFQPLGLDQINQLWGAQGDVPYRPSLAYEIALVPILPRTPTILPPMVGALATEITTIGAPAETPAPAPPAVVPRAINTQRSDWTPQIAFVSATGELQQSLALAVGSPELTALRPRVLLAGAPGTDVTLAWEIWDVTAGWRPGGTVQSARIDLLQLPDEPTAPTAGVAVTLPFTATPGQAVLSAHRQVTRADGKVVTVRSNPLLVTLFGGGA